MNTAMNSQAVPLVVGDDLRRSRVTVFFRILLVIPHIIWITLWTVLVVFAAILNWLVTLVMGRPPQWLHRFLSAYVHYSVQLNAYLYLVANPYPSFTGASGYPVDVELPSEPQQQSRWKTLLRLIFAIPAFVIAAFLGPITGPNLTFTLVNRSRSGGRGSSGGSISGGGLLASICAFQGWFASLALGRMPRGLRDGGAYGIGYGAQVLAYALVLTDRYPNADPTAILSSVPRPPEHPVHVVGDAADLRRSRLTVFFRGLLVIPHFVWLILWGFVVEVVVFINWFAVLIMGQPPRAFHRFIGAYLRYQLHVYAYWTLAANPFPGFTGEPGYPLDLVLPAEPQRQHRAKTFFRLLLAIPAWFVSIALVYGMLVAAFFMWFVALFTGQAPVGLRNLQAYALRYLGQVNAYLFLITDRYPNASPLEGAAAAGEHPSPLDGTDTPLEHASPLEGADASPLEGEDAAGE
jgi:hypothetical protein